MSPGMPTGRGHPHTRFMPKENALNFRDSWKAMILYMMEYRIQFLLSVIAACITAFTAILGPHYLSEITDVIEYGLRTEIDMDAVVHYVAILAAVYLFGASMSFVQNYCMSTASQRTASRFRHDIARKINLLPLRYFDTHRTGDILSRITNDVDTIGQSLSQSVVSLANAVTLFFGSLIMMMLTDWRMASVAVLTTLIGIGLMKILMSRSGKYFVNQQHDLGAMNSHVDEVFSGHTIVKAYGMEARSMEGFTDINRRLYHSAFISQFISRISIPLSSFVANLGYVSICIVGAIMYVEGTVTFGTIVAFMFYSRMFSRPLSQISETLITMQSVAAAGERVFEFLAETEVDDESDKVAYLHHVRGHVEFRDVHFGYRSDREVIHGFSAIIEPGQKVAIVGPTGAGKTTMVNLLMRFYDISDGEILIDGVPTKDLTRENVRNLFGMVLQDAWIFNGTIRENIVYCREGVTDRDMDRVCEASGLRHFIDTLPEGYDTVISESSALSSGQRQQITIARAMILDPPMLILDEATSSVDTRTERTIQDAMDRLTEGRTSFVIAHRLSTIRNADLILVMKDGCIVEKGTHDGLMAEDGYYRQLYESQFSDE